MCCRAFSLWVMLLLGGCATGATRFTCDQFPVSGCQPVSQAYDDTNGELDEYDYRGRLFGGDLAETAQTYPLRHGLPTIEVGNTARSLNYAVAGDPIFSPPQILRVLMTEWEDSERDFHGGGFIYLVIEDGQWLLTN